MSDVMAFHAAVEELLREVSEKAILPLYQSLADDQIIAKHGGDYAAGSPFRIRRAAALRPRHGKP